MKAVKTTTTMTLEMRHLFEKNKIKKSEALRRGLYFILEERKAGLADEDTPFILKAKITRMAVLIKEMSKSLEAFREFKDPRHYNEKNDQ